MRDADRGRVVKPSTRTVGQFLADGLAAVEPLDATMLAQLERNHAVGYLYIGAERLQRLDEPRLLRLYAKLPLKAG